MKKSQALVLMLLSTASHWVDASDEQPAKLYEMYHDNWYGSCSPKRCPNPFDDLMFEDNDQIQFHGGSCQEWINHKNNNGNTRLHYAIWNRNIKRVEKLIELGAEVNQQSADGHTPLHVAVYKSNYETIQLLLTASANVNEQNKSGNTPLHWAAKKNRYEIVQLLLASGAHVNQQNKFGNTPLHDAVYNRNNATILLLLATNASATIKNNRKESPIKLIADNQVTAEMFYQAEATIRNRNREFRTNEETRTIFNEAHQTAVVQQNNSCCSIS